MIEQDFTVGEWVVHPRQHRISRRGTMVDLEPKVMHLLLRLAESPGRVVLHEELLEDVWSGTVVSEEAIFRAISALRRAFGDDPRKPTIVETIPKAGYRLLAPVEFTVPGVARSEDDSIDRSLRGKRLRRSTVPVGLAVVAVAFVLFGQTRRSNPRPFLASAAVTTFQGFEIQPALSPDAKTIAFIWSGPDNGAINVYVQSLAADSPLQLTDDGLYEFSPAWSPDGSELAFARSGTGIIVRPAIGGSERLVSTLGPSSSPSLDWSPIEDLLVVSDVEGRDGSYRLYLVRVGPGTRRMLTEPPSGSIGDRDPTFSPDGRHIAFVRRGAVADELDVVATDGGPAVTVVADGAGIAGVDWTPDGRALVYSTDVEGPYGLWQVPSVGGEAARVMGGPEHLRDPSVSGSLVAYTRSRRDVNLWAIDPATGEGSVVIGSSGYDGDAAISTTGTATAFISDRSGSRSLYVRDEAGTEVRLTDAVRAPAHPAWSPDDRWIVFDAVRDGFRSIFLVSVDGGPVEPVTNGSSDDVMPTFGPDGVQVYYASRTDGSWSIQRTPVPESERAQTNRPETVVEHAFRAVFTSDGTLLFSRPDSSGVWIGGESGPKKLTAQPGSANPETWCVDGSTIWVLDRSNWRSPVFRAVDVDGPSVHDPVPAPDGTTGFVVRGGRFIVERLDHAVFDIMLATRD